MNRGKRVVELSAEGGDVSHLSIICISASAGKSRIARHGLDTTSFIGA